MENKKEKLEDLLIALDKLKETMTRAIDELSGRVEDALKEVSEAPKEPKKYELIPFDIEKAKQGAKIVTTEGANVRIICYDRKSEAYPIVAAVMGTENDDVDEEIVTYTKDGTYYNDGDKCFYDLRIQKD